MTQEEANKKIADELTRRKDKKTKFYFNELVAILGIKPREAKKLISQMVRDGILEYWSSGSTTMYGLKGAGVQAEAEKEKN